MTRQLAVQQAQQDQSGWSHLKGGTLQRKCASCGNHTLAGDKCSECRKKKWKGVQTKLKIGDPDDAYEREADRIADQVMAMPTPVTPNKTPIKVQRFSGHASGEAAEAPPSVERVLNSPGKPLPPDLAEDMGKRFGHDFSGVRIHTDSAATQSARDVTAHAYTGGHSIVFAEGQYAPGTIYGKRLLAHELTHVVQQAEGNGTLVSSSTMEHGYIARAGRSSGESVIQRQCAHHMPRCNYYTCREDEKHCGGSGYYLGYGGKYCRRFNTRTKPKLSAAGKNWVDRTTACLQRYLENQVAYDTDCETTRRLAFDSHAGCYVEGGICNLPVGDWWHIFQTIDMSDLEFTQAFLTGVSCPGIWWDAFSSQVDYYMSRVGYYLSDESLPDWMKAFGVYR